MSSEIVTNEEVIRVLNRCINDIKAGNVVGVTLIVFNTEGDYTVELRADKRTEKVGEG